MIENYLSVQDTITVACFIGVLIKTSQFLYFDKLNKRGGK